MQAAAPVRDFEPAVVTAEVSRVQVPFPNWRVMEAPQTGLIVPACGPPGASRGLNADRHHVPGFATGHPSGTLDELCR